MASGRRHVGVLLVVTLTLALGWASSADAYVYWTNTSVVNAIGRAGLDGSAPNQTFVTTAGQGADVPGGVAVDGTHVYWPHFKAIGRASLDGSGANPSFITGAGLPNSVAADTTHIYWTSDSSNTGTTIGRASLDGSGADPKLITTASTPIGVAVAGAAIYWANYGTNTIGRANLDGSGVNQSFITGATYPRGVAVDGAHVYWTNGGQAGTIGRANLDGSGVNQSFITGATYPYGVAVNATHIYWANSGNGTIGRANLDGSAVNQRLITDAIKPRGVAVDALGPSGADTTAPVVSLSAKKVQKAGKLVTIAVSCPGEACTATATGILNVPGAGAKRVKMGKITRVIAKGGRVVLRLKVPVNARRAIARALRAGKRVTARITVTARDAAGNAVVKRRTIKLRT